MREGEFGFLTAIVRLGTLFSFSAFPLRRLPENVVSLMLKRAQTEYRTQLCAFIFSGIFFFPLLFLSPAPLAHILHPLRLASRPNRSHIGGGGWTPSCGTCVWCFYREWVQVCMWVDCILKRGPLRPPPGLKADQGKNFPTASLFGCV